jgi:phosphopantetheinyl transferase
VNPPVVSFLRVDADAVSADLTRLTAWERARHDRLRVESARRAYVAAHLLVRDVLRELSGEALEIAQRCTGCGDEDHGAPYVVGRPDLFVSLSHSHQGSEAWVAAIAAEGPCGIDVQVVSRVPDRALTARELTAAGDDLLHRNRLWARKEALIKSGAATLDDLGSLDVLDPDSRLRDWEHHGVVGAWIG